MALCPWALNVGPFSTKNLNGAKPAIKNIFITKTCEDLFFMEAFLDLGYEGREFRLSLHL